MKAYRSRSLADTVGTAGSMLMFLIFTVCMLIIIAAAASAYSRIVTGFEHTFGVSAPLKYVSGKIRGGGGVSLIEGGKGLSVEDGGIVCVIYSGAEGIYESNLPSGSVPDMSGGELIFGNAALDISDSGDMYVISASYGGETSSVSVRKG